LVVEADGTAHAVGEVRRLDEGHGEPESPGGVDFRTDRLSLAVRLDVGVGRRAPEPAVDAEVVDRVRDVFDGGLVGVSVLAGTVLAEVLQQVVVDER
jgi:hypothetical protein